MRKINRFQSYILLITNKIKGIEYPRMPEFTIKIIILKGSFNLKVLNCGSSLG